MKLGLNFVPRFLEPEERKPLSWPINNGDEDDSVITGDDSTFHCKVASTGEEEFEAFSDFIFDT
jgi:hypothetical protein